MSATINDRKLSLVVIASESDAEYARLVKRRKKGDLFYVPNPESLYAWELKASERHESWGHTSHHSYTEIYLTKALAIEAACEIIRKRLIEGKEDWGSNEILTKLLDAGKHEDAIRWVEEHYSSPTFEIRSIEIRCSPNRYEISDPADDTKNQARIERKAK